MEKIIARSFSLKFGQRSVSHIQLICWLSKSMETSTLMFGTLEWSSDEKYLIYIAEEKPKKSEPFIKRKPAEKDKDGASGDKKAAPGEEFVYRQDWGEQLTGKKSSVIVQCEVESETLTILQGLPDNKCPGQAGAGVLYQQDQSAVLSRLRSYLHSMK
ncbi:unnamed protein product [Leptidea sinapis]|uniref:Acylamino-acid-releasing enzyme N-terminal domain-containing protein n=1 Tax=Leptidea sinapis TaxID=189913 RepID=A0A5E4QME9_9NEOP|nr:unnamed protein product [Leptidea sinapis]